MHSGDASPIITSVDDVLASAPAVTLDEAIEWAQTTFGIAAEGSFLPSERDQNVLLQAGNGDRFVLKIANGREDRALLEAQNEALDWVARRTALCPRVVAARD